MCDLEFRPTYAVSAPTGRRNVAAGGASQPQCGPTRNPWKEGGSLSSSFRPGGAKEILGPPKGRLCPALPPPPRGGYVETRTLPRVAHRPLCSGRCSTRGYNPPPRWGEKKQFQVSGSKFQVNGRCRSGSPACLPAFLAGSHACPPGLSGGFPIPAFYIHCEINNVVSHFAQLRLTSKGTDQNRSRAVHVCV